MSFEISQRVAELGPIDLYVSEAEYGSLKRLMRTLWQDAYWTSDEQYLALAFLRGYTFYREPSEHDSSFWTGFYTELDLYQEIPSPTQYDNLWRAFRASPQLEPLLAFDGRGRAFVTTIDAAWGIRSLRAQALIDFFVAYYREYPGATVTREVIGRILDSPDETVMRQADAYNRIFGAMTRVVNCVLEQELENLSLPQLEAHLTASNIDLGQPNALRYFTNKSSGALETIIRRLRFQRTPQQFGHYLQSVANHLFRLPNGSRSLARNLTLSALSYGRYLDLSTGEEHAVVPSARVSLQMLERLPFETYTEVTGFCAYVARNAFSAESGRNLEKSVPFYSSSGLRHLWFGKTQKGVRLQIGSDVHPGSVGWAAETLTRLDWTSEGTPSLKSVLKLSTFLPDAPKNLTVEAGEAEFNASTNQQDQQFIFDLPLSGLMVRFGTLATWNWTTDELLFSATGSQVTAKTLKYGPKTLYLVSSAPPRLRSPGVSFERVAASIPIWRILWDGRTSLKFNSWVIEAPLRAPRHHLSSKAKRSRSDITIHYQQSTYQQDDLIEIELYDPPLIGAVLRVAERQFVPCGRTFLVRDLPAGTYIPELILNDEVIAELSEVRVLPPLVWEFPKDSILIQGHTYASRVVLPDGRFETFRWKPQLDSTGQTIHSRHEICIDEFSLPFELEAACFTVHCLDPKTVQPIRELRKLDDETFDLKVWNPYARDFPIQVRLSSAPERSVTLAELVSLQPTSRDQLLVEVCTDKRSESWSLVTKVPIHVKPVVSGFKIEQGYCFVNLSGPSDLTLRIDELEPRSNKLVTRKLVLGSDTTQRIRLVHPEKLRKILVSLHVSTYSNAAEVIRLEHLASPLFDFQNSLKRGVGWSTRD